MKCIGAQIKAFSFLFSTASKVLRVESLNVQNDYNEQKESRLIRWVYTERYKKAQKKVESVNTKNDYETTNKN